MGLTEKIAERVGIKIVMRYSHELVACDDAAAFLDGCESAGVLVLGIEGFLIRGNNIVPDMDAIADFSGTKSAFVSVLEARRFVKEVSTRGLMLEFILKNRASV